MTRQADIIGWAHTAFGRLDGETVESLVTQVAGEAVAHAGLQPSEIDEIVLGHFNGGLTPLTFTSSLVLQADEAFRFTPATRVENACATGSAAVRLGVRAVASEEAARVLVVGVEKMTAGAPGAVGRALLGADYDRAGSDSPAGFAGVFADIATAYQDRYGDHGSVLADIAAKNHRNGVDNPYAQIRKDLGFDFCNAVSDRNPLVAGPLRRTDCSPVSDGAAALVLAAPGSAPSGSRAVRVRAMAQCNEFLPLARRDPVVFEAGARAWNSALKAAGADVWDLDLVELHDCFTVAELIEYEMLGLCAPGHGRSVVEEGLARRDGRLPVNPSGGLKSKGHPVGATGVSQHVLAAMQLADEAGAMQVPDATTAGVFNMGGTAVANYATILERVR